MSLAQVAIGLLALTADGDPSPSKERQYEVYSAVLVLLSQTQHFGLDEAYKPGHQPRRFVVQSETIPAAPAFPEVLRRLTTTIDTDLVDRLVRVSAKPSKLGPHFVAPAPVVLVSSEQVAEIFNEASDLDGGWRRFFEVYPGAQGLLRMSGVVFSEDGSRALLYASNVWDGLMGIGCYLPFESRNPGQWLLVQRVVGVMH